MAAAAFAFGYGLARDRKGQDLPDLAAPIVAAQLRAVGASNSASNRTVFLEQARLGWHKCRVWEAAHASLTS